MKGSAQLAGRVAGHRLSSATPERERSATSIEAFEVATHRPSRKGRRVIFPAAHRAQNPLEIKRTPPQPRYRPDYPWLVVGVESQDRFDSQEHEACCGEDTSTDGEICICTVEHHAPAE